MSAIQGQALPVHQRIVPAASAPPVLSRAPSSVFALGDAALPAAERSPAPKDGTEPSVPPEPSAEPAGRIAKGVRAGPRTGQAIALLRERGPMIPTEVANALGCDAQAARSLLCMLKSRGVGVVGKRGRSSLYGLADSETQLEQTSAAPPTADPVAGPSRPGTSAPPAAMGGFRRWLEDRGEPDASAHAVSRRRHQPCEQPEPTATAVRHRGAKPVKPQGAQPDLLCGLFNNGDLVLELGEQRMRLDKAQTLQLVRYLDLVGGGSLPLEAS